MTDNLTKAKWFATFLVLGMTGTQLYGSDAIPEAKADSSAIVRLITSNLRWKKGVALDIGPGDGSLAIAVAKRTDMVGHCVESEWKSVKRVRQKIDQAGLYGSRVVVQQGRIDRLAYPSHSANLVLCGDQFANGFRGRDAREIYRVLSPNGIGVVGQSSKVEGSKKVSRKQLEDWLRRANIKSYRIIEKDGIWAIIKRLPSPGWDEWTHRNHDPANTLASKDQIPYTNYRPHWVSGYRPGLASAAVALAGGRVVVAGLSYPKHPDTTPFIQVLDAFTGIELWSKVGKKQLPIDRPPGMYSNREFCSDFAVVDDTLYLLGGKYCYAIDLADGKILKSIPLPAEATPARGDVWLYISCVGDTLFAGAGPSPNVKVDWNTMNYRGRSNTVFALDRNSAKLKWHRRTSASTASLTVSDGQIFFCDTQLNLHALDAATGKEVWTQATEIPKGTEVAGAAVYRGKMWVLYNRPQKDRRGGLATGPELLRIGHNLRELTAFSTKNGSRLFDCDFGITVAGFTFSGDTVYGVRQHSSGLAAVEVETGKRKWSQPRWRLKCTASLATPNCLVYRSTETSVLDLKSMPATKARPRTTSFGGFRPTCTFAAIPANGMLYIQAPGCRCPSPIRGSMAMGPGPAPVRIETPERLIEGEAYGKSVVEKPTDQLWATWRANRSRSGRSAASISLPLKQAWQEPLARGLTPACAGYGLLFCGAHDGKIVALDALTGKKRWQYLAGTAIQAAPYLWKGRLFVGDADGWVHCLRADDGRCIWRFRAALAHDRTVSHGRFASLWPVSSGVLVHDDTAYFAAGLLPNEGTTIYALNARTGQIKWEEVTNQGRINYRNGMIPGGPLAMAGQKLYFPTQQASPWQIDLKHPNRQSATVKPVLFGSRRAGPEIMVADDQLISVMKGRQYVWHVKYVSEDTSQRLPLVIDQAVIQPNQKVSGDIYLVARSRKKSTEPAKERPILWKAWKGAMVNVLIEADGILFSGGTDKVYATNAADGKNLWSAAIPSEAIDLASVDGRLFVICRGGTVVCFDSGK